MKKGEKNLTKSISRRRFIKTTAKAGAVAAAGSLVGPLAARAADKPIKIGIVIPYSGVYGMIGKRVEAALRYAFDQSRYKDRVQFFAEDSRVKPAVSVEKAQKLVEKVGVDLIVGPAAGHTALAVSEYTKSIKKLMMLVYGGNVKIAGSNCSRYTFMVGHTTYSVSAPGVPWVVDNLGKDVFLIGADYSTGRDIVGWFREGYLKKGGRVIGEAFPPLGTSEFAPYLSQIMNAKPRPKVVAGFLGGSDAINITKQFEEFGLKKLGIPMVWTIGTYSEVIIKAIGDAAEGNYDIHHWSPVLDHKENIDFMKGFKKHSGMDADDSAVLGHEVASSIIYGLDQTGGDPDNEKMIDAIEKRKWVGPRGACSFGPNHVIIHPTYVRKVERVNGKLMPVIAAKLGPHTTPGGPDGPGGECKL